MIRDGRALLQASSRPWLVSVARGWEVCVCCGDSINAGDVVCSTIGDDGNLSDWHGSCAIAVTRELMIQGVGDRVENGVEIRSDSPRIVIGAHNTPPIPHQIHTKN